MKDNRIIKDRGPLPRALVLRYYAYIALPVLLILFSMSSLLSAIQVKPRKLKFDAKPPAVDETQFMSPAQKKQAISYSTAKKALDAKEREAAHKAGKPDPHPTPESEWDNTEDWFKHRPDGVKGIRAAE